MMTICINLTESIALRACFGTAMKNKTI